jgi:hypothetical protein
MRPIGSAITVAANSDQMPLIKEPRLNILSAAGAGTEIDLIVPAILAFEPSASGGFRDWLARLY